MTSLTAFAHEWLHPWNTHDLEGILSHYNANVTFYSPFVQKINNDPQGCIHGKEALRAYFSKALEKYPDLHFELYHVLESVNSVVCYYKSVENRLSAEMMILDQKGLVVEVRAHYK